MIIMCPTDTLFFNIYIMLITNHINKKYKLDPTRSQKYRINEDVAKSNKVLKSIESLEIDPLEIEKIKKVIGELKKYLVIQLVILVLLQKCCIICLS